MAMTMTPERKAEIKDAIKARHAAILGRVKKKCISCGLIKPLSEFGHHSLSEGGEAQSNCKACKNDIQKVARMTDAIFRIRHHFLTRIHYQLGEKCPEDMDSQLSKYLGYNLTALKLHLEAQVKRDFGITLLDSFSANHHIDHITPLHSFQSRIDLDPGLKAPSALQAFRECWHFTNLKSIPAAENLSKGGKQL